MNKKKKHYFKEGNTVAHIDKLSQQMTIEKLLITVKENPDDPTGRKQRFFHGIKCHWFDNKTQEFQRGTFHKYELVPWDIAETESQAACNQWIYDHSRTGISEE